MSLPAQLEKTCRNMSMAEYADRADIKDNVSQSLIEYETVSNSRNVPEVPQVNGYLVGCIKTGYS